MIYTKLNIGGVDIDDSKDIELNMSQNEQNTTSSFIINFDNLYGKYSSTFNINDEVKVYADDVDGTTLIFNGIIDDINFKGKESNETLIISGREYGSVLQDIIVRPRVFNDMEASEIVTALMTQNISSITTNNVNASSTTINKITFTNLSIFDAIVQLADAAGFYFYVDVNKDLHFEEKESTSSGVTLDSSNVLSANFKQTDQDQYTKVTVIGDRQLTGAESIQTTGTDNTGSVYVLDAKPHNTIVNLSGAQNTILQPGGIWNISDPSTDNIKYLVDFQGQKVVLVSGTAAGDNIQPNGSVVIFSYQRSTPIASIKQLSTAFPKHKVITDRNIKDLEEASQKATTFLNDNAYPKTNGSLNINGIFEFVAGDTVIVNLPFQNQSNKVYAINNIKYKFNKTNNLSERVMQLSLNKKIANFMDITKEQILRLRAIEASETDAYITSIELGSSLLGVDNTNKLISTSIGSSFYFHVQGHNILNSPSSLLGDMRLGSTVFENGIEI